MTITEEGMHKRTNLTEMKSVLEIDKWLYNLPTDYLLITLTSSISGKPCRDQFNLEIKR